LIGEHTDYNDGFALPMALPLDTVLAVSAADGSNVEVVSEGNGSVSIHPSVRGDVPTWALYIAGVIWLLHEIGVDSGGWRAAVTSDIPMGAGLSSSAAIEVATVLAVLEQRGLAWPPIDIARIGQRVENEIVGLPSGIMDQFISAGAVAGHASLLDSRRLTLTPCPIPNDVKVAVMDTGTRRRLVEGAYADRRNACRHAAEVLGVPALRGGALRP
jgi:galactokinase